VSKFAALLASMLVPAFLVVATPALAQEKKAEKKAQAKAAAGKPVVKEILKNDRVRVVEATYPPGAASESVPRGARVVHALTPATLQRTYPDGKVEKVSFKKDESRWVDATPPYVLKNVGRNKVVLYVVFLVK
jgi:hypothetical protein